MITAAAYSPPRRDLRSLARLHAHVGDRLENLDRGAAAVRQRVGRGLPDLLAVDRAAQRRLGRVHVDRRAALLAGGEQERDLVLVSGEADRDGHARAYDPVGAGRLADPRVVQDVHDLEDPALPLALLFLGGVVAAVLPQVALVPGGLDSLGDLRAPFAREVVQLRLEPVIRLLGEPGDAVITGFGHKNS